jgi:hypothetical protein
VGRNAEAAGAASLKSVAGIFSYSKTKGLFAGVSLEGSAIVERKDANAKLYGRQVSARELLTGGERPPPQARPLLDILNSRVFNGMSQGSMDDRMYNDIPVYGDPDPEVWEPNRASTWHDDVYDQSRFGPPSRSTTFSDATNRFSEREPGGSRALDSEKKTGPGRPAAPKPNFASKQALLKKNEAVALYTFEADQPGDLGFKKGDIITVLKKTDSDNDWW